MRLVTLGALRLEGSAFREPQPLLLLTYLALHEKCLRKEVQTLFWPHQTDATKRSKSLSEALRRLKKLDPNLLESGRGQLGCDVPVDVQGFRRAVAQKEYERALALYRGPFLYGLEETCLHLGEELSEWLGDERAALQKDFADVLLTLAEERRRQGEAVAARTLVLRALDLPHGVALPGPYTLGRMHRLLLELGFGADAESVQRAAAELHGGFGPIAVSVKGKPPRQPVGVTSLFVGREAELARLHAHFLAGARLVTLTGLTGIGKTELAKAFVQQNDPLFDPLFDNAALVSGRPPARRARRCAVANFGRRARRGAATRAPHRGRDRAPRNLTHPPRPRQLRGFAPAERCRRAACARLPEPADSRDLARAARSSAERQGAVFSDENAPLLLELCRQVAGVPLALKLVAGWTASLPLAEIAQRLRSGLDTLTASDGTNLKSAFDLSVALLDPETAAIFRKLTVFQGSFSLRAAEHLLGAKPRHLRRLSDASLLSFERDRYSLHPLLAHYARGCFPPVDALRNRHATFYLTALQPSLQPESGSANPVGVKVRVDFGADSANVAAAWSWAVRQGWTHVLQTALPALQRLCDLHSRPQWGLELVEEAAATLQGSRDLNVALQASPAWFLLRSSQKSPPLELPSDVQRSKNLFY